MCRSSLKSSLAKSLFARTARIPSSPSATVRRNHRHRVAIMTDMAIAADNIDEAKAEEARRRAEARLSERIDDEEAAMVSASLANSLAQLRVKRRHRG